MQPKTFHYIRQTRIEQDKLDAIMQSTPVPIQDSPMPPPIDACPLGKKYYRGGREYPVDMLQGYRR